VNIIYALPPIIAAIAYFLVGLFVYSKKKPNPINRSFAVMLLCVSLWNVEWAGLLLGLDAEFVYIWGAIFRIPVLFIPPTFLHFAFFFTNPQGISRRSWKILLFFYGLSCFLAAISWTRYFIEDLIAYPWGYSFKGGPLYILFLSEFIIAILIAFSYIVRGYALADSYHRQRLKYFFLSIGVSFILGSYNFLPVFGLQVYPLGSIVVTVGLFIAAYSVAQHRLMDVSLFMAKGLGYLFSFAILGIPSFFIIIFLEKNFFTKADTLFSLLMVLMGIGAVVLFSRIKGRMDRAMLQIIVRDKYFYHRVLEEFSRRLVAIVDLNRLLNMLAETIEKSMGVEQISVFLYNAEKEIYFPALNTNSQEALLKGVTFKIDEHFINRLREEKDAILRVEAERILKDSERGEVLRVMGRLHAEVCLQLIYSERLIGFINLGHKTAEEMYYREDLDLLNTLTNQIAIAIENATLYENLKKSQNILRRSDRLASLGTLIASLAHEIRNPLVSIKTFTQLLPERIDDNEFRDYFLKVASGEIDRLTSLINELLGFAKPSEPNLKEEDVTTIIDRMEVLISTEARKNNIKIMKNYSPYPSTVLVDAEQIKQVLLNILLNAIQAIEGRGEIWIETRIVHSTRNDKREEFLQIEIRDSGIGILPENLDRVFDPFFSTRSEGSGLGLAISHQIVHEHGGFIDIESEIGKGTSFRIHFPLKSGGKGAFTK
jgi:two-component system NtrC family sensor kinase